MLHMTGSVLTCHRISIIHTSITPSLLIFSSAVFCPLLPVPLNGTIDPTSNTIGSIASYSCDVGYELVGNMMRVCQSNGMWDGEDPQCRPLGTYMYVHVVDRTEYTKKQRYVFIKQYSVT